MFIVCIFTTSDIEVESKCEGTLYSTCIHIWHTSVSNNKRGIILKGIEQTGTEATVPGKFYRLFLTIYSLDPQHSPTPYDSPKLTTLNHH